MKKNLLTYLIIFVILLVILIISQVDLDGIWEYGFSYNISQGLIPYKDFNMVVGPLYNLIFSIPMIFFGNYYFLYEIEHCFLYAIIFTFMYKKIGKNTIFVMLLYGLCYTTCGYNTFCIMMTLSILMLLDSKYKYKDVLIGLLIGCVLMTKQNIGLFLALVYFFTSKEKIKSIIWMAIPVLIIVVYLLLNNALYQYIDYCYLGLGSFVNNVYVEPLSVIPFIIFGIILFFEFKKYLKSDRKDKRILYVIAFYSFIFPILDQGHIIPACVPFVYYLLATKTNKKRDFYIKYLIVIGYLARTTVLLLGSKFITGDYYLKYQIVISELEEYLTSYKEHLVSNYSDNRIYYIEENAYIIKLYLNEKIDKYDLLNDGNMGTKEEELIKDMDKDCENKKCIFILDSRYFEERKYFQYSRKFKNHIMEKYQLLETLPSNDRIYGNRK